jgi:ABC-type nitrate/sulfonate/bicarbonate transport system permease component
VIWQLVYFFEMMPRWAFPSPLQVVVAFYELTLSGELPVNAGYSVLRQFTGVILAAAFGIPVGLALGASPTVRAAFLPLCRLIYPIPGIAWIPLAILWFGIGFTSTVFVIFFTGIWPIIFNTMAGVETLSGQYTDVARAYLAPRSLYTRRILVPGSLPFIITGLRLTYGVGWRVIVGAEMISSIVGLGFLIDNARWQLRPDIMVCGMITIAMIGWISENWFFDWVERRTLNRWGMKANPA